MPKQAYAELTWYGERERVNCWRVTASAIPSPPSPAGEVELKKSEGDTWALSGVNFSERKIVVRLLNASPFSDLPHNPTSILLP
jgi:hypothetical protein